MTTPQTTTASTNSKYDNPGAVPSAATPGSSANSTPDQTPGNNQQVMISRGTPQREMGSFGNYDAKSATVADQSRWFADLAGNDLTHLQDQLIASGDLDPKGDYVRGRQGDFLTYQAYMRMIGRAIYSKRTIDETLSQDAAAFASSGKATSGAKQQGFEFNPTNPLDITTAADQVGYANIGRQLSDSEASRYVSAFQAVEEEAQKRSYVAQGSGLPGGPGGTATRPPDLSAFLLDRIRNDFSDEFKQTSFRHGVQVVLGLINQGGFTQ